MSRTQTNVTAAVLGAATACLLIIGVANTILFLSSLLHGQWMWAAMHLIVACIAAYGLWKFHQMMGIVKQAAIERDRHG